MCALSRKKRLTSCLILIIAHWQAWGTTLTKDGTEVRILWRQGTVTHIVIIYFLTKKVTQYGLLIIELGSTILPWKLKEQFEAATKISSRGHLQRFHLRKVQPKNRTT
jgi:hypothetical protein